MPQLKAEQGQETDDVVQQRMDVRQTVLNEEDCEFVTGGMGSPGTIQVRDNIAPKPRRFLGFLSLKLIIIGYFLQISSLNVILVSRIIYTPGS